MLAVGEQPQHVYMASFSPACTPNPPPSPRSIDVAKPWRSSWRENARSAEVGQETSAQDPARHVTPKSAHESPLSFRVRQTLNAIHILMKVSGRMHIIDIPSLPPPPLLTTRISHSPSTPPSDKAHSASPSESGLQDSPYYPPSGSDTSGPL